MLRILTIVAAIGLLSLNAPPLRAEEAPLQIAGAQTVDCKAVISLIGSQPNLVIVDTRKREDFERGHIEGAIPIVDTAMTEDALAAVVKSKSTPVLFYCNGVQCGRAAQATHKALNWGYTTIFYYAEGIRDWSANQLPLVTN